ncbi:hypothetical protein AQUCO_02000047v1 [Aquilegia coerulea]|uniref:ACT domain-containing protein ACR n=1 Tax=Aquilegia coerulea TaxID=218851 RepID=A0A2G5DFM4_AQUCA|nr:hypothetical protein AQUCO_02000047v1 [Aquilegia coerulea]
MDVCWPYFDPDYENLTERINGPSFHVCIDNESCNDCTVVKVDSVNKQGLLLQVVQALTDMNLTISKSYISSDAGWFMDVFHVRNEHGSKLKDQSVINYIQQAIYARRELHDTGMVKTPTAKAIGEEISKEHTAIELTGTDRPGLFSEISAALTDLRCNVEEAHAWSHNERLACVAYISDQSTASCIDDPHRLASIKYHLATVINATTSKDADGDQNDQKGVHMAGLPGGDGTTTNVERRLHQLMLSVRDFDEPTGSICSSSLAVSMDGKEGGRNIVVTIENCNEKGYSVVSIKSKDRQRLMFDTVCTLTDMEYIIFHASIRSHGECAFQEYYIRHIDGYTLHTEAEKLRVIRCLKAAIERRVCEGVRLELRADNKVGLLSDITRSLREFGLAVVRADVATKGEKATNAFYVRTISGNEVDMKIVESLKKEMEPIALEVKIDLPRRSLPGRARNSFGDMLKSQIERFSHNFI